MEKCYPPPPRKNWNFLDKLIAFWRYHKVKKYVPQGGVMVDIGCGREAAFLMQQKTRIAKGLGFDFRIQNAVCDNIFLFHHQPNQSLNLNAHFADAIFLNAVLEHIPEPLPLLKECKNVLKNNGVLVMTTPTPFAKPILEFLAFQLHIINEEEILEHCHYYNLKDIQCLAEKLNMQLEKYTLFELGLNSLIVLKK